MFENMHPTWKTWLAEELASPRLKELKDNIEKREMQGRLIYPPKAKRLRVFEQDPMAIRAVIVGQDPYHGAGQAVGLSFSVGSGVALPPSLRNIYQELQADIPGSVQGTDGDLTPWEEQGVFLLSIAPKSRMGRIYKRCFAKAVPASQASSVLALGKIRPP